MPDAVLPFIEHIETHLGTIASGVRLREGVQAARFEDRPCQGATSFLTLGLSHHRLDQQRGPCVRIELLVSCLNKFVAPFNPASVLADVCDEVIEAHCAPPRGTVFGPRGRFFHASSMEALYCSVPVLFPEGLAKFGGFDEPFVLIWLVPITASEANYVRQRGWDAFEGLLEATRPELLDLGRESVV